MCEPQPLKGHCQSAASLPMQSTLSIQIGSDPSPKKARRGACKAFIPKSCWQTTFASSMSQRSSQTVPHSPSCRISTRPSKTLLPPTRRRGWPIVGAAVGLGVKKTDTRLCINQTDASFCLSRRGSKSEQKWVFGYEPSASKILRQGVPNVTKVMANCKIRGG